MLFIIQVCMAFYLCFLIITVLVFRESFNVNWSKSSWGGHQGVSSLPIPTGVVCVVWLDRITLVSSIQILRLPLV